MFTESSTTGDEDGSKAAADSTSNKLQDDDELSEVDFLKKSPLALLATELLTMWEMLKVSRRKPFFSLYV